MASDGEQTMAGASGEYVEADFVTLPRACFEKVCSQLANYGHAALVGELRQTVREAEQQKHSGRTPSQPRSPSPTQPRYPPGPPQMISPSQVTDSMRQRQLTAPQRWTLSFRTWVRAVEYCVSLKDFQKLKQQKRFVTM